MTVKASDRCDRTSTVTSSVHIIYCYYCITTLRVSAKLYIPILIHLSNQNIILFDVLTRNQPYIRLNPVPAGYPASISGSGCGPVSKK